MQEKGLVSVKHGFTFIELLVVSALIAILSSIGVVSYTNTNRKARDGKRKADIEQIRSALEIYRSDNGYYPGDSELVSELNPAGSPDSTYLNEFPEPPDNTFCSGTGVGTTSYETCYGTSPVNCGVGLTDCTSYEIGVELESETDDYVKQNP